MNLGKEKTERKGLRMAGVNNNAEEERYLSGIIVAWN
jgi:hypothetical protein